MGQTVNQKLVYSPKLSTPLRNSENAKKQDNGVLTRATIKLGEYLKLFNMKVTQRIEESTRAGDTAAISFEYFVPDNEDGIHLL